jgi:hypothetical protein
MRKISTVFRRNPDDMRHVLPEVTPGCEWVLAGKGVPTRKYDGTCVMLDEQYEWWSRREVKPGKNAPAGFVPVETDETTGKTVGWEPIEQSAFFRWWEEALNVLADQEGPAHIGTYELVGPKVNGNPEHYDRHILIPHATAEVVDLTDDGEPPWTLAEVEHMVRWAGERGWEGIVWHHPDGRMAKLKAHDFQ